MRKHRVVKIGVYHTQISCEKHFNLDENNIFLLEVYSVLSLLRSDRHFQLEGPKLKCIQVTPWFADIFNTKSMSIIIIELTESNA